MLLKVWKCLLRAILLLKVIKPDTLIVKHQSFGDGSALSFYPPAPPLHNVFYFPGSEKQKDWQDLQCQT